MAVLEEEGYLAQPHTSAGRVPTDKGYRLFVDRLATVKPLSSAERRAISSFPAGAVDVDDIVHRTSGCSPSSPVRSRSCWKHPASSSATVRHVEVISLSSDRVLVILIDSLPASTSIPVTLSEYTEDELETWRGRLNAAVAGHAPQQADAALAELAAEPEFDEAGLGLIVAALRTMLAYDPSNEVVVAGMPNLMRYGASYQQAIGPVVDALEEQVVLLRLLGDAVAEHPGEVTVRIGQENPYVLVHSTPSLVASEYGSDEVWASLGVVGPTSMDYSSTISAVRAVARYVGRFLAEG